MRVRGTEMKQPWFYLCCNQTTVTYSLISLSSISESMLTFTNKNKHTAGKTQNTGQKTVQGIK